MKLTELMIGELERQGATTRRLLERVPDGRPDWKPHEKSMPMGYLAALCATLPSWIVMIVEQDELELSTGEKPDVQSTAAELVALLDTNVAKARAALEKTNDEYLLTTSWKLMLNGRTVMEEPRHIVLRDSVFDHLAHHCGQLTVYLRLNEALVPATYGPSADEGW